mmetsp:Transcript_24744/g.62331  ORF Transcript_24744/g.62331 Transcript_24744/m.62331 type:complete len:213 (-) Transcript_24744:157-795(-)
MMIISYGDPSTLPHKISDVNILPEGGSGVVLMRCDGGHACLGGLRHGGPAGGDVVHGDGRAALRAHLLPGGAEHALGVGLLDEALQRLGVPAHNLAQLLPTVEADEGRHRAHAAAPSHVLALVDVHHQEAHLRVLGLETLENRLENFAGAAPVRGEHHHRRLRRALAHHALEVRRPVREAHHGEEIEGYGKRVPGGQRYFVCASGCVPSGRW